MLRAPQHKIPLSSSYYGSMKPAVIGSALLHIGLVVLLTVGLPFLPKEPQIDILPPVSVEVIDISEIAQTNNPAPAKKADPKPKEEPKEEPPPPPEPEKQVAPQMMAEAPPDLTQPEPPVEEDLPEPDPVPPPPKPAPPKPKPDPPKKVEKKPEVTKTAKPKAEPKKEEKQQQEFASLLKNLAQQETASGSDPAATAQPTRVNPDIAQLAELANRLTISEQDALKRQLSQCWVVLAGAKYAERLAVELRVYMNPDRTVQKIDILDKLRYSTDSHYRAAADAAYRALRNPRCSPLDLPPNKYELWKVFVIGFDPSEML